MSGIDVTTAVKNALLDHSFILSPYWPEQKAIAEQIVELITPIVWRLAIQHAHDSFVEDPPFNGLEVLTRLDAMKGQNNADD